MMAAAPCRRESRGGGRETGRGRAPSSRELVSVRRQFGWSRLRCFAVAGSPPSQHPADPHGHPPANPCSPEPGCTGPVAAGVLSKAGQFRREGCVPGGDARFPESKITGGSNSAIAGCIRAAWLRHFYGRWHPSWRRSSERVDKLAACHYSTVASRTLI